jgi:hypothetical protein
MSDVIAVLSTYEDTHAAAVGACLEAMGENPVNIIIGAFPVRQQHSLSIGNESKFVYCPTGNSLDLNSVKSLWHRRPGSPELDSRWLSPYDEKYIAKTLRRYGESLVDAIAGHNEVFSVNDPRAARRAESKALQLLRARACGLNVPPTLISNSIDDIRAFYKLHGDRIICKPLIATAWEEGGESYAAMTTIVTAQHLEELPKSSWAMQPAIYQPIVDKIFELRLVIFGDSVFCMKIDSQKSHFSKIDWRGGRTDTDNCFIFNAPEDIVQRCKHLMSDLGIVFACFDFAFHEDGTFIFFELNQAGQFLWMERVLPEMNLCFSFASFLAGRPVEKCPDDLRLSNLLSSGSFFSRLSRDKLVLEQESYCDDFNSLSASFDGTAVN